MKVKEFIRGEYDIDVYDDLCEELGICACCPIELTDEGARFFADVLEYDIVYMDEDEAVAVVHVQNDHELQKAKHFFWSAAGYCNEESYSKWFKEV